MLECALTAPTGDDVFSEDPTVLELEAYMANLFEKEKALFLPSGTMSNLVALLSHCHARASEIIIGTYSHLCIWEGGGVSNLGGIHTRQIRESNVDATFSVGDIRECWRTDNDDHFPKTEVLCLENTHNLMGGIALPASYISAMGDLARDELDIRLHVDGARIFNAAVSQNIPVGELCRGADSVSVCLSKGLGAPLGTVLVGETDFIRLAKRARKRCGGGMRQAGVVASMGLYAVQNNVERLKDDHDRAQRLAMELKRNGFQQPRDGAVDTNLVFFGLPDGSTIKNEEFCSRLESKYGVKIGGGYRRSGSELFRAAFHMNVSDEDTDRAIEAIVSLGTGS
jgi:threonine aldolase